MLKIFCNKTKPNFLNPSIKIFQKKHSVKQKVEYITNSSNNYSYIGISKHVKTRQQKCGSVLAPNFRANVFLLNTKINLPVSMQS